MLPVYGTGSQEHAPASHRRHIPGQRLQSVISEFLEDPLTMGISSNFQDDDDDDASYGIPLDLGLS